MFPVLVHATDIHLSHASPTPLVESILTSGAAAVILTGDIAEGHTFDDYLATLAEQTGRPVYFTLGNHDYYYRTRATTHRAAERVHGASFGGGSVHWLRETGVVDLGEDVALVGVDGLYDAGWGTPESGMVLNDFTCIEDLRYLHRRRVIETVQEWGRESAARGRELLLAACVTHRRVFFATHVPPFPEAVRDKGCGKHPSPAALPWYCSRSMGEMLLRVAGEHLETEIVVLCGHTHQAADEQIAPNLRVMVGAAEYFKPSIARRFETWPGMIPSRTLAQVQAEGGRL